MAPKRIIDLNNEAKEELNLSLCLSNDKGKRPIDGFHDKQTQKKKTDEVKEEVSIGRYSEDMVTCIERKIEHLGKKIEDLGKKIKDLEKLPKCQELAARVKRYFFWSAQCFYNQIQRSVDCLIAIYTSLYHIAQFLKPKTGLEMMLQFTTPKPGDPSTRPPRF